MVNIIELHKNPEFIESLLSVDKRNVTSKPVFLNGCAPYVEEQLRKKRKRHLIINV